MFSFFRPTAITSLNLSNFNTSNVTDMRYMFNNCKNLVELDLSNFDTSNVIDMQGMFHGCSSLTKLDIRNFDFSKVTNYYGMLGSGATTTFVPFDCLIIVKDDTAKKWMKTNISALHTNIKTVAEL